MASLLTMIARRGGKDVSRLEMLMSEGTESWYRAPETHITVCSLTGIDVKTLKKLKKKKKRGNIKKNIFLLEKKYLENLGNIYIYIFLKEDIGSYLPAETGAVNI